MEIPTLKEPITNSKKTLALKSTKTTNTKKTNGNIAYGTGRRKSSVARVWVKPGKGVVTINGKNIVEYFPRDMYRHLIEKPFIATNTQGQFDIVCTVKGGGTTGQAGAIMHGTSRALDIISEDNRPLLKKSSLLTRDPRAVERKKYGRRKARKRPQFSKR
ncbi:MAG: 30S ribosomal protein S9 [Rickettsiaceae bacterium]|nr:30S ribosomal protein S9 [Rickettsiaceae bacterium]